MNPIFLETATVNPAGGYTSIILLVAMLAIFYFVLIAPQKKKEKKDKEMRNSIEIGDGITTIGGIIGRVVSMKDDTVLIESGSDRTKLRINRWAIQSVEKLKLDE